MITSSTYLSADGFISSLAFELLKITYHQIVWLVLMLESLQGLIGSEPKTTLSLLVLSCIQVWFLCLHIPKQTNLWGEMLPVLSNCSKWAMCEYTRGDQSCKAQGSLRSISPNWNKRLSSAFINVYSSIAAEVVPVWIFPLFHETDLIAFNECEEQKAAWCHIFICTTWIWS